MLAEGIEISKKSLCVLTGKYKRTGSVADERKTRRPRKFGDEHLRFIDDAMAENVLFTIKHALSSGDLFILHGTQ